MTITYSDFYVYSGGLKGCFKTWQEIWADACEIGLSYDDIQHYWQTSDGEVFDSEDQAKAHAKHVNSFRDCCREMGLNS